MDHSRLGVDVPPIPPTSPPHEHLLKELGVGGVLSASLSIVTARPPCKQMLAAVVGVIVIVVVVLLSVVYRHRRPAIHCLAVVGVIAIVVVVLLSVVYRRRVCCVVRHR